MAGQVAYHLMAQAGMTRAPWPVTTIVSCLPVLVLGMGTALAHMLRADAEVADMPDSRTGPPTTLRSLLRIRRGPDRDQAAGCMAQAGTGPIGRTRTFPPQDRSIAVGSGDQISGLHSDRRTRPAWLAGGLLRRGSQYHGVRCAVPESGAPTKP